MGEAYEPLYGSMLSTSSLLLVGLVVALLASLFVARRVLGPLELLRKGTERIGGGDLDFRLNIKTGDEIEVLADEFNKMTEHLSEAYTGLERKVAERTQALDSRQRETRRGQPTQVTVSSQRKPRAADAS